jgi:hypothetical protein
MSTRTRYGRGNQAEWSSSQTRRSNAGPSAGTRADLLPWQPNARGLEQVGDRAVAGGEPGREKVRAIGQAGSGGGDSQLGFTWLGARRFEILPERVIGHRDCHRHIWHEGEGGIAGPTRPATTAASLSTAPNPASTPTIPAVSVMAVAVSIATQNPVAAPPVSAALIVSSEPEAAGTNTPLSSKCPAVAPVAGLRTNSRPCSSKSVSVTPVAVSSAL